MAHDMHKGRYTAEAIKGLLKNSPLDNVSCQRAVFHKSDSCKGEMPPSHCREQSAIVVLGLAAALALIPAIPASAQLGVMVNSDGAFPIAGLALLGDTLYGTAQAGGRMGHGAVFGVGTDGSGFACLHSFMGTDGMNPYAPLTSSSNMLYGTANCGGGTGSGTVFTLDMTGTNFSTLYNFSALSGFPLMNGDGADPYAGLMLSGRTLYGYRRGRRQCRGRCGVRV